MPGGCWPKVGAAWSVVGRPEECGRRFRNTQERRDVGLQQVTGRNFRVDGPPGFPARVYRDVSGLALEPRSDGQHRFHPFSSSLRKTYQNSQAGGQMSGRDGLRVTLELPVLLLSPPGAAQFWTHK